MVNSISFGVSTMFRHLAGWEDGQDLVEYALVAAMIAFAAVAGLNTLASSINSVLNTVGSTITSAST